MSPEPKRGICILVVFNEQQQMLRFAQDDICTFSAACWRSLSAEVLVLRIGIVGLAQVGKTTLFRILTHAHARGAAPGKLEASLGVVQVPDERLDRLSDMY